MTKIRLIEEVLADWQAKKFSDASALMAIVHILKSQYLSKSKGTKIKTELKEEFEIVFLDSSNSEDRVTCYNVQDLLTTIGNLKEDGFSVLQVFKDGKVYSIPKSTMEE